MAMTKESRKKMLGLIHAQKRALEKVQNRADEIYATILLSTAGVDSAAKIETSAHLSAIIEALNEALKQHGLPVMGGAFKPTFSLARSVENRAARILGPFSRQRLQGYLKKMGRDSLAQCTAGELRRVQGFLSAIERGENR